MPRRPFINSTEHYYHVHARCINREWFGIPMKETWSIAQDYLYFVGRAYKLKIAAFVLMPNHFHLLVMAPEGNLSASMNYFMREFSKEVCRKTDRINHVFGARFGRTLIKHHRYFRHAYKYIYRNPVKANIVRSVEDYRFSTLVEVFGQHQMVVPVNDPLLSAPEAYPELLLQWLNTPPLISNERAVKSAMKRPTFSFARYSKNAKAHFLDANEF